MMRRSVGMDSRMRVSSVTTPSLSGTLKSTRMKTRFPRTSRSSMVSLFMICVLSIQSSVFSQRRTMMDFSFCSYSKLNTDNGKPFSEFGGQELDEVAATAGVAPLVVVPGQNFYAAVADDLGVFGIDDRGIRIAFEVGGDEFLFGVGEDALHGAVGGGFQCGVYGILGGGLVDENGEVDDADVGRGHAHGVAVELALQFGNDEMQRFGGAGGAGNHIDGGGAGTAQVLVRQVEEFLIVGVRVDGGHGAAVDAESFLENFGDGSEAVGGAGSVGNDLVLCRIVGLVIHTEDESRIGAIGGRGDEHFLYGRAKMLVGIHAFGKEARRFDNDIRADRSPIDFSGILGLENLEAFPLHGDGVLGMRDLVRQIAEDGVVLQKV